MFHGLHIYRSWLTAEKHDWHCLVSAYKYAVLGATPHQVNKSKDVFNKTKTSAKLCTVNWCSNLCLSKFAGVDCWLTTPWRAIHSNLKTCGIVWSDILSTLCFFGPNYYYAQMYRLFIHWKKCPYRKSMNESFNFKTHVICVRLPKKSF